jgi:hypothetical protein
MWQKSLHVYLIQNRDTGISNVPAILGDVCGVTIEHTYIRIMALCVVFMAMCVLTKTNYVSGSWFRASAMTTMNKKPTRCTIVLKSLKLYCILIPLNIFRALLRPSSGAS